MNNFELIDDYLANRLQEQDRKTFEQQLEGDPALKEEFEFQKQVVDGVRTSRAAELKSMLNNVPVGGSPWSGGKLAAGVISAGLVVTSLYFYYYEDPQVNNVIEDPKEEIVQPGNDKENEDAVVAPAETNVNEEVAAEEKSSKTTSRTNKEIVTKPVRKPDLQVVDPSEELAEDNSGTVSPGRTVISASRMEVITESADKRHTFHYQFVQGKLLLFGPFDHSLYEILEIHGDGHAVFLFYQDNYYMLDEKQTKITALTPIRDQQLLQKLKEYRGR